MATTITPSPTQLSAPFTNIAAPLRQSCAAFRYHRPHRSFSNKKKTARHKICDAVTRAPQINISTSQQSFQLLQTNTAVHRTQDRLQSKARQTQTQQRRRDSVANCDGNIAHHHSNIPQPTEGVDHSGNFTVTTISAML